MRVISFVFFFFLMIRRPPRSTLFPYTRSSDLDGVALHARVARPRHRADLHQADLAGPVDEARGDPFPGGVDAGDRKSTRLNSSHLVISYAVFCLKKKKHPDPSTGFADIDCTSL